MNKSQPIKSKEKLDRFKNFYIEEEYNPRNYMFISLGLNTALRVSDLLKFTWNDVYNFDNGCFRTHVKLTEQKTTKQSVIFFEFKDNQFSELVQIKGTNQVFTRHIFVLKC